MIYKNIFIYVLQKRIYDPLDMHPIFFIWLLNIMWRRYGEEGQCIISPFIFILYSIQQFKH